RPYGARQGELSGWPAQRVGQRRGQLTGGQRRIVGDQEELVGGFRMFGAALDEGAEIGESYQAATVADRPEGKRHTAANELRQAGEIRLYISAHDHRRPDDAPL